MPTYEYKCNACGHRFEAFQSIREDPVKVCPSCGEEKVERLISAGAGLIFKGSGFYITDHRSEAYKQAARNDNGSSVSHTKPKTMTRAETKAEKKTGTKTATSTGKGAS